MDLCFYQNYLSSKGKSWKDLLQEALRGLEQGTYTLTGEPTDPTLRIIYCDVRTQGLCRPCPQMAASLQAPSCACAVAWWHLRSWSTSIGRTSLHLNCQVGKVVILIEFTCINTKSKGLMLFVLRMRLFGVTHFSA